jgi:hypothetical protein
MSGMKRTTGNRASLRRLCNAATALAVGILAVGAAGAQAATNPALSGFVADSTTLPGATALAIAGHYAYVTDYYAGRLSAIDFSKATAPVIAGSSPPLGELMNASTVNVAGGYAFVASKNRNGPLGSESNDNGTGNSLTILDIASNPASPSVLGVIRDANTLFGAYGVAVSGHYAFVASQGCLSGQPCPNHSAGNAFATIDIGAPAAPVIVAALHNGSLPSPWKGSGALAHATSVAISENYAYVTAANSNRLTVISIANPLNPQIVASLNDATNLKFPVDVAVSGKYAYVVDQITTGRLTVVDVTNPAKPQIVTSIENTLLNGAYRVRLHGDFAYVSASGSSDVAVIDVSNPLSPRIVGSVQSNPRLHKTTGLDVDPSGKYVLASSPYLSTQTQPLYPPYALEPEGPILTGTVSAITLDPKPIAVSIAPESQPANPTALTSANFAFSVNDAVSTVQCQLDAGAWGPCSAPTAQSYAELGVGSHIFQVQAIDAAGNTSTVADSWTVTAPANTESPSIVGQARVGQTLSATTGSWSGAPSFAYQWERCNPLGLGCLPIEGATNSTYTAVSADAGSTLAVQVTATSSAGSTSAQSSPTTAITAVPANTSPPTISGNTAKGETLSAGPGSWAGYPAPEFTYQWQRCDQSGANCGLIEGAVASTYTLETVDVGTTLKVTVEATNSVGSAKESSSTSAIIAGPPVNTSPPTTSGNAVEGETLSATPGSWAGYPTPSLTYQWQRCNALGLGCLPIEGATNSTYTAVSADAGSTLAVQVTATSSAGSTSAQSNPTTAITAVPANTSPPTISGNTTENTTLSASTGSWTGYPPPEFTYQWQRCNALGTGCETIAGATSSSYVALAADVGNTLAVTVTATNSAGSAQVKSATTAVVASAAGPLTPLLDSFARPNNSGPPGPNWTHMAVSSTSSTNDLYITNQQVTGRPGSNADYWNTQAYGPNSELWVTVAVKPNVDLDPVVLGLRFQNPGAANASGYQAYYIYRSSQPDQYKIIRRTNGTTSTTLASSNGPTLSPGDQILFRAIGTTLELWRMHAGAWARLLTASDSAYQGAGYLNLTARNSAVRLAGFGGGTLP